jgi:hypothetical protein
VAVIDAQPGMGQIPRVITGAKKLLDSPQIAFIVAEGGDWSKCKPVTERLMSHWLTCREGGRQVGPAAGHHIWLRIQSPGRIEDILVDQHAPVQPGLHLHRLVGRAFSFDDALPGAVVTHDLALVRHASRLKPTTRPVDSWLPGLAAWEASRAGFNCAGFVVGPNPLLCWLRSRECSTAGRQLPIPPLGARLPPGDAWLTAAAVFQNAFFASTPFCCSWRRY